MTLLASDLVLREGGVPVQLAASPGRVNRLRVPEGGDPHELGHVLAGRRRPFSGELVVDGLLLPEQREAVNRKATFIELGRRDGPAGPVDEEVRAAAHLATLSMWRRRAFVERTFETIDELTAAATAEPTVHAPGEADGNDASVDAAIVEASLAIAGGATVIVMTGTEHLTGVGERDRAESLAVELARRGVTVIVLGGERDRSYRSYRSPETQRAGRRFGSSRGAQQQGAGRMSDE